MARFLDHLYGSVVSAFSKAQNETSSKEEKQEDRGSDMVKADHPEPVLAPDGALRTGPDRISYMTRLQQEHQKLLDDRTARYERSSQRSHSTDKPLTTQYNMNDTSDQQSKGNQPVQTINQGNVRIAVFENEREGRDGKPVKTFAAVAERSYFDKSANEYRNSTSFNQSELLLLSEAARNAANYMQSRKEENYRENSYSDKKENNLERMGQELEQTNTQSSERSHSR